MPPATPPDPAHDPNEWEPDAAAGWDQGGTVAASSTVPQANPRRLARWRVMRRVTWICGAAQFLPAALWFMHPRWFSWPETVTLAAIMAAAAGLVLAPYAWINAINLFYCLWFGGAWHLLRCLRGDYGFEAWLERSLRFAGAFLSDTHESEFWLIRIAMAAAVVHLAWKGHWLSRASPADRSAVQFWWRRPADDEVPQAW